MSKVSQLTSSENSALTRLKLLSQMRSFCQLRLSIIASISRDGMGTERHLLWDGRLGSDECHLVEIQSRTRQEDIERGRKLTCRAVRHDSKVRQGRRCTVDVPVGNDRVTSNWRV
jgi:hypothetical protein